jgi:hypothetical protein
MNANRFHKSEKPEKEVPPIGAMPPEMPSSQIERWTSDLFPQSLNFDAENSSDGQRFRTKPPGAKITRRSWPSGSNGGIMERVP